MKRFFLLAILLVFIIDFSGCNNLFAPKETVEEEEIRIRGPLLARVNDWAIGLDDFQDYIRSLEPLAKIQKIDINSSEFKIKFLNDLVKTQILAQIATDRGLDKSEDVLRALRDTRDTLLAAKIREELKKNITVSYAEIKAFYDKNKQYFKKPQEVKIREIIVDSESSAKDLYVRLLQGESFDALARQYSTAESRSRGGERDWISPTPEELQTNVKFWAAIATVEKGNLSNIFKGDDNKYYIVKVEDIRGGQDISLSEVEKKLEDALRAEKIDVEESKLIDKFKQKARVEKSEDLLK